MAPSRQSFADARADFNRRRLRPRERWSRRKLREILAAPKVVQQNYFANCLVSDTGYGYILFIDLDC
ncbi:hypothetical protein KKP04_10535 [Rhodomicrobium sp. Az07]|uniref:hypothetical protein n=1 Tax=Rhodomicrobium sp. Az07 TaxID=2839034 RepID=UPI001BE99990|nr:hypothetical protein [Rhodomicrobium sp. Az07]MBT3071306.1 hypothetical protein [Rhodomicrobium sp. Az07]